MAGPGIRTIRRRLTQIIKARPDELSDCPVIIIRQSKILIGKIRPGTTLHIITGALMVIIHHTSSLLYGKFIDTTRTYSGSRLRTKHNILWKSLIRLHITVSPIIKTGYINHCRKPVGKHASYLVHTASNGACRVFAMANILQERSHFVALGTTLGRNLISYTPHYHTRIVPIMMQHVYHILFCPFVEIAVITILTFGNIPFIERFQHHHKAHLVTEFHQFGCRHIVGGTDCITSHILQ